MTESSHSISRPFSLISAIGHLVSNWDNRAVKAAWGRVLRAKPRLSIRARVLAMRAEVEISRGNHIEVTRVARSLRDRCNSPQGNYYLAQSCFLRGDYAATERLMRRFLEVVPNHPDAVYLLVETLVLLGERESAWQALEQIGRVSRRLKTWLVMANMVQTDQDYHRLLSNVQEARDKGLAPAFHPEVNKYIANGALRCCKYSAAREIWRQTLLAIANNKTSFVPPKNGKANYSPRRAETALADLKSTLMDAGIPIFLVSGTLLGCIREGRLLGHDKDIDVGIWEDVPRDLLLNTLRSSGLFYVQASRSPDIIRVKHVNGIAGDVFYHYREADDYWHGGVKVRWHNKPFNLVNREFLGQNHLIPEKYDQYLTENYGDWRVPRKEFDSAYDTPNAELLNENELIVHVYQMLFNSILKRDFVKIDIYLRRLQELGDSEFIREFKELVQVNH